MHTRWCTRNIPSHRRLEFWRDAVCEAFVSMTPEMRGEREFDAALDHRRIDNVRLNLVRGPGHGVMRTHLDLAAGGNQYLFVNLNAGGPSRLRQLAHEQEIRPGELLLIDSAERYQLRQHGPVELISLAIPHARLGNVMDKARRRTGRILPSSAATRLLAAQMQCLSQWSEDIPPLQAGVIADTLTDFLYLALEEEDAPGIRRRGHPLERRVRTLLEEMHGLPELDPQQAAQLLGISVRTLHAALAAGGTSFMQLLIQYRLERARGLLLRGGSQVSVRSIAEACGFRSAAHFARRFQSHYGYTPSSLLRQPRGGESGYAKDI
jgi:AraC-like DNA-binding protein